jgi:hypothetical protein
MASPNDRYRSESVDQALAHLVEELGEATAAAGKSLRFGLESVNPELSAQDQEANLAWLEREMNDVAAAYAALETLLVEETGLIEPGELGEPFRRHSRAGGRPAAGR